MIDFELLKQLDMEVINVNPTPEEDRAFSEFLKAYRAKEARNKKARAVPSRSGKKVKAGER
jgi:hypothetical protein